MKRLNFTILFICVCFLSQSFGQYCNEPTEFGSTIDVWDWTQETFTVHLKNTSTGQTNELTIDSPFYGNFVGQPNTDFLASGIEKPFSSNDGWELIIKEFGKLNNGVRMPTFILYNRISGKLRTFIYLADKDGVNQVNLETQHYADQVTIKHVNALLESAANTPMFVIENYTDQGHVITSTNVFEGNAGLWLLADIPTTYDPCTCEYASGLIIRSETVNVQDFTLELDGGGTLNQIVAGGTNQSNFEKNFNVSGISDVIKKGSKSYKGINGFINTVDKSLAGKINENLTPDMVTSLNNAGYGSTVEAGEVNDVYQLAAGGSDPGLSEFFNGFSLGGFSASIPPFLKTAIPYVGAASSVMSLFSAAPVDPPMNFSIDLNFTGGGQITEQAYLSTVRLTTPGSDHSETEPRFTPVYDNVLGVANIVEVPVILYASDVLEDNFDNSGDTYTWDYEEIHSMKLGGPIKYAVNPATGLDVVDAKAALYFKSCRGGEAPDINLIQESGRVWRTPYMSLSCLEEYSIVMNELFTGDANDPTYLSAHCAPEPELHLVIDLGETMYAGMYKVRMRNAPYAVQDTPNNPFADIPETATTDDINEVLNGNIEAWGGIQVTGGVLVTEDNVDLLNGLNPTEYEVVTVTDNDPNTVDYQQLVPASKTYVVGGTANGVILQNPPDCAFVEPVDYNFLRNFCRDREKYNPIALRRIAPPTNVAIEDYQIQISPNPTDGNITISLNLTKDDFVSVKIYNLLGQEIQQPIRNEFLTKGGNNLNIDISNLSTSTYILEVISSNGRESERIIKN